MTPTTISQIGTRKKPKNPSGVRSDAPMMIDAQASGVGSIPLRRAPRPVASSMAAKDGVPSQPVVRVKLAECVDRLSLAFMGGVGRRPFSMPTSANADAARSAPPKATAPWPLSPLPRSQPSLQTCAEEDEQEGDQGCEQESGNLVLASVVLQLEKVSAGAVSLLGSPHVRARPAKNNSPMSAPAIGRKRSKRSALT